MGLLEFPTLTRSRPSIPHINPERYPSPIAAALDELHNPPWQESHMQEVADWLVAGSQFLLNRKFDENTARAIWEAGYMHDIGKSDPEILPMLRGIVPYKKEVMNEHVIEGERMLLDAGYPRDDIRVIVLRYHHLYIDGTGYPKKYAHETIPPIARLFPLLDSYSAMTRDRGYNRDTRDTPQAAFDKLQADTEKGLFDPDVFIMAFAPLFLKRIVV